MEVFKKHFGTAETKPDDPNVVMVNTDSFHVTFSLPSFEVTCDDPTRMNEVQTIAGLLRNSLVPMKTPTSSRTDEQTSEEQPVKNEPSEMN